jgi:hypothetical protein
MKRPRISQPLIALCLLWLVVASDDSAGFATASAADARIRIIFFTPSDVEPPNSVPSRMKEVVDYGQNFYSKWLTHWGYEPELVLPIDRDEQGIPQIYYVRGDQPAASGAYDSMGFHGAVMDQAVRQYNLPRAGSTFWIFVYGTKLKASRGFGGAEDRGGYGWAVLVWHDIPGELPLDLPMCRLTADRINLKGYLHELGHTMNLPHVGPLDEMAARHGMSLMGPNSRSYRRARRNREEKVHLTQASAALIWKTPQMTGTYNGPMKQPTVQVDDFAARHDKRQGSFRLTGRLKSNVPAHSVVVINAPDNGPKDYWKKAHAARMKPNGEFDVQVTELSPSAGVLQVVFCFDNGYITGTGKGYGYKFAAKIPYAHDGRNFTIPAPAH